MLRILGRRASINVRKVSWACDEIGCAYELDESDAFRSLNPNGLMPVLIDGEHVLWESNTIVRYLFAKQGRMPATPIERARVEQWMDWQATELNDAWRYAFLALVREKAGWDDRMQISRSVDRWNVTMGILDEQLSRNPYVAGDGFSAADVVIGMSTHRWLHSPIERPHLQNVARYYAAMRSRAAFQPHALESVP